MIGLGAQSLISDVMSGFFLLFENLIAVGDVIEVGPHTGVVESVGLRVTKIRKFSGELRIVPNGELSAFGLHTAGLGPPGRRGLDRLRGGRGPGAPGAGRGRQGPGRRAPRDGPRAADRGGHPAVRPEPTETVLRLHARVVAVEKVPLEFEARRRVKEAFAAHGIRVPRAAMEVRLARRRARDRREDTRKESVA